MGQQFRLDSGLAAHFGLTLGLLPRLTGMAG